MRATPERWIMASSPSAPTALPQPAFAGLGRRLAAYLLDVVIAASVMFIAGFTMRGFRAFGLSRPAAERAGEGYDPIAAWHALGAGAKLCVVFGFVLSMGPIYLALFELQHHRRVHQLISEEAFRHNLTLAGELRQAAPWHLRDGRCGRANQHCPCVRWVGFCHRVLIRDRASRKRGIRNSLKLRTFDSC
jgi:hypothetical protein